MMQRDDLDNTAVRRALTPDALVAQEGAEALYRTVDSLRDYLSIQAQKQLAIVFEWAREGIGRQTVDNRSAELEALHAAYSYARDVLLASAKKNGG